MPIIFQQIEELLDGRKTNTRRVAKMDEQIDAHLADEPNEHTTFTVAQYLDPEQDGVQWVKSRLVIDRVLTPIGRVKWEVGRCQSIIPKRGLPALWLSPRGQVVGDWRAAFARLDKAGAFKGIENAERMTAENLLYAVGYSQPWLRIERIRLEHVQDITEEDAQAEGCPGYTGPLGYVPRSAILEYESLWKRINTRKGTRWDDNPWVFALDLKRVGRFGE